MYPTAFIVAGGVGALVGGLAIAFAAVRSARAGFALGVAALAVGVGCVGMGAYDLLGELETPAMHPLRALRSARAGLVAAAPAFALGLAGTWLAVWGLRRPRHAPPARTAPLAVGAPGQLAPRTSLRPALLGAAAATGVALAAAGSGAVLLAAPVPDRAGDVRRVAEQLVEATSALARPELDAPGLDRACSYLAAPPALRRDYASAFPGRGPFLSAPLFAPQDIPGWGAAMRRCVDEQMAAAARAGDGDLERATLATLGDANCGLVPDEAQRARIAARLEVLAAGAAPAPSDTVVCPRCWGPATLRDRRSTYVEDGWCRDDVFVF